MSASTSSAISILFNFVTKFLQQLVLGKNTNSTQEQVLEHGDPAVKGDVHDRVEAIDNHMDRLHIEVVEVVLFWLFGLGIEFYDQQYIAIEIFVEGIEAVLKLHRSPTRHQWRDTEGIQH